MSEKWFIKVNWSDRSRNKTGWWWVAKDDRYTTSRKVDAWRGTEEEGRSLVNRLQKDFPQMCFVLVRPDPR